MKLDDVVADLMYDLRLALDPGTADGPPDWDVAEHDVRVHLKPLVDELTEREANLDEARSVCAEIDALPVSDNAAARKAAALIRRLIGEPFCPGPDKWPGAALKEKP